MVPILSPDLNAPWHRDTVLQLRTSKMKPMQNLSISTGIYKEPRTSRVFCSSTGLESDEHDLTFHGGTDKAVHQYYPGHYASWRSEYPYTTAFEIGGFGENIVSSLMNERNVCIGDIIRIGEVLLQVSLPRQPCFKLNHRFGLKNFSSQTWKKSRTGWYYRVLEEGWMGVGDSIELVERRHARWTIERIQEFLHRDKENLEMVMELEQIPEFGNECKKAFKNRVTALQAAEAEKSHPKEPEKWVEFILLSKTSETPRISSFVFSNPSASFIEKEKDLNPGCFARLKLPHRLLRSYSIVSGSKNKFTLGIALDEHSRGGSKYLHESLREGDTILVGKMMESVPIKEQCSNHIFIAGGIGITAFLGHVNIYDKINFNYTLHFAVRSLEDVPFKARIDDMRKRGRVVLYQRDKGERMDIEGILSKRPWGSFVYTCGPIRMIEGVEKAVETLGIGSDEVHYEAFQMDVTGDPFSVEIVGKQGEKNTVIDVPGEKSLLQCIREKGLEIESSCEVGNCGACRVTVREGKVEHRGSALNMEDKLEGGMLSCVSRGVGRLRIEW
ncbi:related to phthalate 4,5-dioxygenase oxygenase reductase subunit [Rhynchosporium agropyri]|uniref:Related to phthalate 4,5-dioxygenase oxygenase reductase subunit n=1 Tax=Rhynchosporium agropyri TaxID=914238 RepID=A0A1E1KXF9_9HELO|nr:related to phthalate 4,5-dioxygenase oxygenase reductase subunit [Rhynchosporium agropyri]